MKNLPIINHSVLQDPITKEYHININIRVKAVEDNINLNINSGLKSYFSDKDIYTNDSNQIKFSLDPYTETAFKQDKKPAYPSDLLGKFGLDEYPLTSYKVNPIGVLTTQQLDSLTRDLLLESKIS